MIRGRDIKNLGRVYRLLKKANMTRVFFKEMQGFIQSEGEGILGRISPEDERAMKSTHVVRQSRRSWMSSRKCYSSTHS